MRSDTPWMFILCGLTGLLAACSSAEVSRCASDAACPRDAACAEGFCVDDPLPRLVLVADRDSARLGDEIRIDGEASATKGGKAVELEFKAEPADAVEIEVDGDSPRRAVVRMVRPHVDVVVKGWGTSPMGRKVSAEVTIAAINSAPRLSMRAIPEQPQPGSRVELIVEAEDPDGDPLTYEWTLESERGSLEAHGASAFLQTAPELAEARYKISVTVSDGRVDGISRASITLDPRNQAPSIEVGPPVVTGHHCEGEPLACSAKAKLTPVIHDVGPIAYAWRLLDPGGLEATFEPEDDPAPTVTLRCEPACAIAGTHRFEVVATDSWGERASATVEVEVGNRPPILQAHDGSALEHTFVTELSGAIFRVARAGTTHVRFVDPDGDPVDPASVRWSSNLERTQFDERGGIHASFTVTGTPDELRRLQITLVAADINGAAAADTASIPILNETPIIEIADDLAEGHRYAEGERMTYRKMLDVSGVHDPEGGPLTMEYILDLPEEEIASRGLEMVPESRMLIVGGNASSVGFDYSIVVRAKDAWGDQSESTVKLRLTNRAPSFSATGFSVQPARSTVIGQTSMVGCCSPRIGGSGVCDEVDILVWTEWPGQVEPGPFQFSTRLEPTDPDGDPLVVRLSVASASAHLWPKIRVGESSTLELPLEVPCPTGGCPISLIAMGKLTVRGVSCAVTSGTPAVTGAFGSQTQMAIDAYAEDSLGGSSSAKSARFQFESR